MRGKSVREYQNGADESFGLTYIRSTQQFFNVGESSDFQHHSESKEVLVERKNGSLSLEERG